MDIKEISPGDRDNFFALCRDFYENHATLAPYNEENAKRTFTHLLEKHENLWGYLLWDSITREAIGYSLVSSYWCNEEGGEIIVLDELYISPQSRHNGYGTRFLEWLESHFRGKAVEITLEVLKTNQTARSLYRKNGLEPDGFETFTKKL